MEETTTITALLSLSDETATLLDSLYVKHRRAVFSHIYLKIKDVDISRDLTQDTFVKAARAINNGQYQDRGFDSAWLMRIAGNICVDYFRKNNKLPALAHLPGLKDPVISVSDTEPNWQTRVMNVEIENTIKSLIDRLPQEQKEVVIMRTYLGIPFKEIAIHTNVSINTALGRMRYALINMRRLIQKHNIELDGHQPAPDN